MSYVLTSPLLIVPLSLGAAAAGWAVWRKARRWGRAVGSLAAFVTAVAVFLGVVQGWAIAMVDRSSVARSMTWRDADTGDWRRFYPLPVARGGEVLQLRPGRLPDQTLALVSLPGGGEEALDGLLARTETTAFIVLRGDEILLERYPGGGSRSDIQTSFSVAKSLLSTLVGIAIDRGEIGSLDDPITDYVPELEDKDERFAEVRLRHLVTMSSGLRYEEHGMPWSDDATTYYAPDLRAAALTAQIEEPPGTRWHYNNYNPLLVGLALERATGTNVADYTSQVLWRRLGAEAHASWSADSERNRFPKMESGFNARAMDFARFGYLFAHEGRVGDRQVVPAAWVTQATARDTSTDPAEHYQYWWWVDTERKGRFYAHGNKGQFVYVDPATDTVVVRMGREYGLEDWPSVLRDVADRVERSPDQPCCI